MAENDEEEQKPLRPVIRFEKRSGMEGINLGMPGFDPDRPILAQTSPQEVARMLEEMKRSQTPKEGDE